MTTPARYFGGPRRALHDVYVEAGRLDAVVATIRDALVAFGVLA